MIVYELTHLFFHYAGELVYSPKNLGIYYSHQDLAQAVRYYSTQPGFCDNQDAFSLRERNVSGAIVNDSVFEAIIYLHSEDFKFETEIELGLYGDEVTARNQLIKYCRDNSRLVNVQNLIVEKIVNKCIIGRKEWSEGFSIIE